MGLQAEGPHWAKEGIGGSVPGQSGQVGGARKETGDPNFILRATASSRGWRE